MSNPTPNRYYSAVVNSNHASPTFQYVWDTGVVFSGNNPPSTGNWRAVQSTDLVPQAFYSTTITGITAGQYQIPVGALSYSANVISGSAFINGVYYPASTSVNGGNYGPTSYLRSPINIGTTGGYVIVKFEN